VTRQSTIGLSRRRCTAGLAVSVTANPWTSGFAAAGPASGGVGAERRPASPAAAWLTLPPTPSLPKTENEGIVDVNGTKIFFAQFGRGPHVLFLHGGYANSNYWGHQIDALSSRFAITAMDTRGHGRSPLSSRRFGYDVFAGDAASLLDRLEIKKTWVVGWSDGAITGLLLTIIMPDRIAGVFAFGANSTSDGIKPGGSRSLVFPSSRRGRRASTGCCLQTPVTGRRWFHALPTCGGHSPISPQTCWQWRSRRSPSPTAITTRSSGWCTRSTWPRPSPARSC
jgi:pimeloyl-ACP methyl ester carboxylesterase